VDKYYSEITADSKKLDLKLKEVWQYRDLIWLFTKRDFTVSYTQTVLGPLWLVISPLFSSLIYCFVFGGIAKISTDGIPQMLFYLTGTAIWTYFANCVTNNAGTFTTNAALFGKVYFPRLTIPFSRILAVLIQFAIQFLIVLVFLVYYVITGQVAPNYTAWLLIPVILIQLGLLGMGVGIIISSVTTKYRDLSILVGFGVSLWMYVTPVVYPLSQVGDGLAKYALFLNPVTPSVELLRYALLGRGVVDPLWLLWSLAFTAVVVVCGILLFNRVERTFMDTV